METITTAATLAVLLALLALGWFACREDAGAVEAPELAPAHAATSPTEVEAAESWDAMAAKLTRAERMELADLTDGPPGHNGHFTWNEQALHWEDDFNPERHGPRAILPVSEARAAVDRKRAEWEAQWEPVSSAEFERLADENGWSLMSSGSDRFGNGSRLELKDGRKFVRRATTEEQAVEVAEYEAWRDNWHWPGEQRRDPRLPSSWAVPYGDSQVARENQKTLVGQQAIIIEPWREDEVAIVTDCSEAWACDDNSGTHAPAETIGRAGGRIWRKAGPRPPREVVAVTREEWRRRGFPEGGALPLRYLTVETKSGELFRIKDGEDYESAGEAEATDGR